MMTPEKKIRSLIFAIVFLLITNIALLLFLVLNRDDHHKTDNRGLNTVGTFLKDEIGFDDQQMSIYQNLRKSDFERGKPEFDSLKAAKGRFYLNIYNDTIPDSVINKLAVTIGEAQIAVDRHMLRHFKSLRRICTPAQLPKFDSSFKTVVEKVTMGKSKKK
ncbi:MAG: hypothetical protein ABIO55_15460 [Ginsengibacter sp.]